MATAEKENKPPKSIPRKCDREKVEVKNGGTKTVPKSEAAAETKKEGVNSDN